MSSDDIQKDNWRTSRRKVETLKTQTNRQNLNSLLVRPPEAPRGPQQEVGMEEDRWVVREPTYHHWDKSCR